MGLFTKGPKYVTTDGIREVYPADEKTGSGPVFRSLKTDELVTSFDDEVTTQWEMIKKQSRVFKDKNMLGTRDVSNGLEKPGGYIWKTYGQVFEEIKQCAAGLKYYDLIKEDSTGELKLLGLCGSNRPEWVCAEFACFGLSGTTVPFYTTYNKDQFAYAINLTEIKTIICNNNIGPTLLQAKAESPSLSTLVFFDEFQGDKNEYESAGLKVLSFSDLMNAGKEHPLSDEELGKNCTPDSIFSFVWTSGTTGHPKGALITQRNMIANLAGFYYDFTKGTILKVDSNEFYLSYLPIAHAMERTLLSLMFVLGGSVGFYRGQKEHILEDLACLRPTIFASVPRLLNRIYDKLYHQMKNLRGIKGRLVMHALYVKLAYLKKGYLEHKIWDKLFRKIKVKLGLDRVKLIATGSAPIASHVLDFLRVVFACPVLEGYGQTEVTCVATGTEDTDFTAGHVGKPSSCAEIKLVSVPEMGYLVTDKVHGKENNAIQCNGRGEICVRGPCTLKEYYKNPQKSAETLDKEGFVHTGDIGLWLPGGRLKIIDRKKNIFKLAQGEYVAPEKIEGIICRHPLIAQAFVHGDSLQSQTVAIVYPDPEQLIPWGIKHQLIKEGTPLDDKDALDSLTAEAAVNEEILKAIETECKAAKAFSFEIPKAVYVCSEEFSSENKILTDTFKLKRNVAREIFAKEITALYEKLAGVSKA